MFTTINGFKMAYDDVGEGPAVILMHGFPLCRKMWKPQIDDLVEAGYRVITPDHRGFGESTVPGGMPSMDAFADDIVALMDHLNIEKAAIGGMSMGGYILLSLLDRYMERLSSAIFIVTRAIDDNEKAKGHRTFLAEEVSAGRSKTVIDEFESILFAESIHQEDPALVLEVRQWMTNTAPDAMSNGLIGMRERKNYLPELHHFQIPALVIGGEEDVCIPPENSEAIAEAIAHARLEIITGAGHMANMENPTAFNACLIDFLNCLSRRGKT